MTDIKGTIDNLCQRAIQYGKAFSKNLDFSENSLKEVESILDYYNKDLKGNPMKNWMRKMKKEEPTDKQIWSMATIWGAYLGEVICRNNPGKCRWVYESSIGTEAILHLKVDNNNRAYPLDKVYKRLKNGPEDNIVSFYDVFKAMVLTNKLSEIKETGKP
jgi:hypothetical protein